MKQRYNNEAYEELINEFIKDTYYVEGLSYTTKIEKIRQYTEIIIRRMLNCEVKRKVMIGDEKIRQELKDSGYTDPWFENSLKIICRKGGDRTHTQKRHVATEEEYNKVIDALFNLYAYLFYVFFKKYKFGSNPEILTSFSLLPPLLRYIVLSHLFEIEPDNISIIDKLALATLKAFDLETAEDWIEEHRSDFSGMSAMTEEAKKQCIAQLGPEIGAAVIGATPNMYDSCREKVHTLNNHFDKKISYDSFETALKGYKEYGHVNGDTTEVVEFNSLMEFIFMGRREEEKQIENLDQDQYVINRVVTVIGV